MLVSYITALASIVLFLSVTLMVFKLWWCWSIVMGKVEKPEDDSQRLGFDIILFVLSLSWIISS